MAPERLGVHVPGATLRRLSDIAIGEYNFAGQYQQQPAPLGVGMVEAGWLKTASGEQPVRNR